jgi:hypothetical protein
VLGSHPERADAAFAPVVEDEVKRRAAVLEAFRLQRRELVGACEHDRAARDVRPLLVPGEEAGVGRNH